VINRYTWPSDYAGDILYFMRVLMFIAFLSMGYALSQPQTASEKKEALLLHDTSGPSQNKEWAGLMPWQKKASEKAIERYAGSQEKKWRRWNEAMFEGSG
jgi:hypothetical protein